MPTPDKTPRPHKGISRGQVHDVFKNRLRELAEKGLKAAKAMRCQDQREWYIPATLGANDLLQVAELHKPSYDRTPINTNYLECFQSPKAMGTVGDVVSLKLQIDYVAMEERAFRFRHASVCRNLAHAMSRRRAHGDGPAFPYIEQQAGDAIQAGAQ